MINASKFPKTAFHDCQTIQQSADEVSCRARTELPRYFSEAPKPQAKTIEMAFATLVPPLAGRNSLAIKRRCYKPNYMD